MWKYHSFPLSYGFQIPSIDNLLKNIFVLVQCSTSIMSTTDRARGMQWLLETWRSYNFINLTTNHYIIHFRRMILTFIMGVSLVFAAFSSLLKHAMEQVYAEPIRRRPHYQATKSWSTCYNLTSSFFHSYVILQIMSDFCLTWISKEWCDFQKF